MDNLAQEWEERFDRVWNHGNYRKGSMEQRMVPFILGYIQPGMVVNDYCTGTGRAIVEYYNVGIRNINMVDISCVALEDEAAALVGNDITFTQAALWDLPVDFPKAPWGLCIDALMFFPPEKLDDSLAAVRRTCDNLIVEVYDWSDPRCGIDLTTIKGDREWWANKLAQFFLYVSSYPSEADRRYVFVCKGE